MKKTVKMPDGTKIIYEGTPEELAQLEKLSAALINHYHYHYTAPTFTYIPPITVQPQYEPIQPFVITTTDSTPQNPSDFSGVGGQEQGWRSDCCNPLGNLRFTTLQ